MQNPLEYTAFDRSEDLSIAAKVYNVTSGSAVIDSTVALSHVVNGSYFANFQSDDAKDYIINIQPYTDSNYTASNTNYTPASLAIKARNVLFKYNTALSNFTFPLYDSSGSLVTGQTVTATRSLDGAAFAACANSVSELASGLYTIDLAASDMSADEVVLKFAASGARTQIVSIFTDV